jgi:hypothetical protein
VRAAAIVLLAATAACGGERSAAGFLDATTGGGDDAPLADDSQGSDESPFGTFDAALTRYDAPTMAYERCDPPCAPDQFCLALVVVGGGRLQLDPLDGGAADAGPADASPGCHPLPEACAGQPTCACVDPIESPDCTGTNGSGCHDDGGSVVVECYILAP